MDLHIDIETHSSVDLKTCGLYRYVESPDFEILMVAYAFDDERVRIVDLAMGEQLPAPFLAALADRTVKKYAHNATFERQSFKAWGLDIPTEHWHCSAVKAAYCGLPLSLDMLSKALRLEDKGKSATGKAVIKYFSTPCKPSKTNGGRTRNLPHHDLDKWEQYKAYCVQDVEAEREALRRLDAYEIPTTERELYLLDQEINDRGILIDTTFAQNAYDIDGEYSTIINGQIKDLTGIDNPNSPTQLKEWIGEAMDKEITTLAKDQIPALIEEAEGGAVGEVLELRQKSSKTSIRKYTAMLNCTCADGRAHGLFQFYGANRTGRWAGRLIQLQNLPQNHLDDLDLARSFVRMGKLDNIGILYDDVADTLSQLIRTAFIAPQNRTFAVADFSSIEARVISWLAGESWRLNVFATHGKIYEASAAMMFGVPIEEVTKGSSLRQKGKVAELALGYQGSVGALKTMGGERMGLSGPEMQEIVDKWRRANPAIVQLWKDLEGCAKAAVSTGRTIVSKHQNIVFQSDGKVLTIKLPSGRKLFYQRPAIKRKTVRKANGESWEAEGLTYWGMDQVKKQWLQQDTYGGKLAENIVQAIARDLLAEAMLRLNAAGFKIVMHVHDEVVCEVANFLPKGQLKKICDIMSAPVEWAKGLPLGADGYLTDYYKKD